MSSSYIQFDGSDAVRSYGAGRVNLNRSLEGRPSNIDSTSSQGKLGPASRIRIEIRARLACANKNRAQELTSLKKSSRNPSWTYLTFGDLGQVNSART